MDTSSQIKHGMKLVGREYYTQHLYIVSAVLPVKLTIKEIEVLAAFMDKGNFTKITRSEVKQELDLSTSLLSNYLKVLLTKGYIKKVNDNYELNDLIKLKNGKIEYNFILEKQSE